MIRKVPKYHSHQLLIQAQDYGSPSLASKQTLNVIIEKNGNAFPKFIQSQYEAIAPENQAAGYEVITVGAEIPASLASYTRLRYHLLIGADAFNIDGNTGYITTKASLDREKKSFHLLVVGLKSKSSIGGKVIRHTDTSIVNVTVIDENDNGPVFGEACRNVSIPENAEVSLRDRSSSPFSASHVFIHAVTASDLDQGENGRITYKLASKGSGIGNWRDVFRLESETGRLYALPLDREDRQNYYLIVTATDNSLNGRQRSSTCELTVTVTDANDNDPSFSQYIYSTSVKEDISVGTEVLRISASDPDFGRNSRLRYSIENPFEFDSSFDSGTKKSTNSWIGAFAIDEQTGSIFTVGTLDRELISEYTFDVLASDDGHEMVRSTKAKVSIIVTDANDHTPEFDEFPFRINITATPPTGVPLLRLSAHDNDIGPHSQLSYNLVRADQRNRYQLSPDQGILTIVSTSSEESIERWQPGTVELLEVTVSDAGRPARSSTGLIEVTIEGGPAVSLSFERDVYHAELQENPESGTDISGCPVKAVRSDGRRQNVIYSFVKGNELSAFEINSNNGLIRVRDPEMIDYEKTKTFTLTVSGKGLGARDELGLNAYTTCVVSVRNVNDNPPSFGQDIYRATVMEGLDKESIVTRVVAFDLDRDRLDLQKKRDAIINVGDFLYEIIEGNVDGAFTMKTSAPGVLFTNTVLDREIRETYELTIAASDNFGDVNGPIPSSQDRLKGVTKVIVKVIDANDSPLRFPELPPMKASKDILPGAYIGTIRANDIDIGPMITYKLVDDDTISHLTEGTTKATNDMISIDTFTGQLFLLSRGFLEASMESVDVEVNVEASDGMHTTQGRFIVNFEDSTRACKPKFKSHLYNFHIAINETTFPQVLGNVDVMPCSSRPGFENMLLNILDEDEAAGDFSISSNGSLIANRAFNSRSSSLQTVSFGIEAKDRRTRKSTMAVVVVRQVEGGSNGNIDFVDFPFDPINIQENRVSGNRTLVDLKVNEEADVSGQYGHVRFNVNSNPIVDIDPLNGHLYQVKGLRDVSIEQLPREVTVSVERFGTSDKDEKVTKKLRLTYVDLDAKQSQPKFSQENITITLRENSGLNTNISICSMQNLMPGVSPYIQIISGNKNNIFALDAKNQVLLVKKRLSDFMKNGRNLMLHVVLRTGSKQEFSICKVQVVVKKPARDRDDSIHGTLNKIFPVDNLAASIKENLPAGTFVFKIPTNLTPNKRITFQAPASALFSVDQKTGIIRSKGSLDYESGVTTHHLRILANTSSHSRLSVANIQILTEGQDEYAPQFHQPRGYNFSFSRVSFPGNIIGEVRARDQDDGPDGFISYSIVSRVGIPYFTIDSTKGAIILSKALDSSTFEHSTSQDKIDGIIRLKVEARSKKPESLRTIVPVSISIEPGLLPVILGPADSSVPGWVPGIVVGFFIVVILLAIGIALFCRKRIEKLKQSRLLGNDSRIQNDDSKLSYVGPMHHANTQLQQRSGGIRTTDPYLELAVASKHTGRFAPPQYSEIASDHYGGSSASRGSNNGGKHNNRSELSEKSDHRSASSGRGSVEEDADVEDVEIRMINEGSCYLQSPAGSSQYASAVGGINNDTNGHMNNENDDDKLSCVNSSRGGAGSVNNTEEYLARLGIDVRKPPHVNLPPSLSGGGGVPTSSMSDSHYNTAMGGGGGSIYNRIPGDTLSEKNSMLSGVLVGPSGAMGKMGGIYGSRGQPSMTGSLSSIVHSEEELAGSYNWDYLLDWGPQYQPLAHVFKEISRLRDDEDDGSNGTENGMNNLRIAPQSNISFMRNHQHYHPSSNLGVAVNGGNGGGLQVLPTSQRLGPHSNLIGQSIERNARSPIGAHPGMSIGNSTMHHQAGNALSPNFHPALSPLATKSPSVSPLAVPAPPPMQQKDLHKTTI